VKLTDFDMLQVVSEDGRRLGHLFDLRAHGRPTAETTMGPVDQVVYGTMGLLQRLGVRRVSGRTFDWDQVVAIRDGKLIVRV
jgi:hypothetical protein